MTCWLATPASSPLPPLRRALAASPDGGFVSGSHDMTLRVWSPEGRSLAELVGHTAIIYSVAVAGAVPGAVQGDGHTLIASGGLQAGSGAGTQAGVGGTGFVGATG